MSITKNSNRQEGIVAEIDIGLADLVGGTTTKRAVIDAADLTDVTAYETSIALPVGAVVVGGRVIVQVPFDSGTSDVLDVGDASDDDRYLNDADLAVAGETPLVPTGFIHTAGEPAIEITWNGTGDPPEQGLIVVEVTYYVVADVVEKTVNVVLGDLTSGAAFDTGLTIPVGAVVIGGEVTILTEFDSSVSDVLDVGDETTGDRYLDDGDLTDDTSPIPLVPTGFVHTADEASIEVTWTGSGDPPTVGAFSLTVRYYVVQDLPAIDLPPKAIVLKGGVTVLEAFDSETSDTIDVGDSGDPDRYKAAGDIATLGRVALVPTGYKYAAPGSMTVRWNRLPAGTAPTTGRLRLDIVYFVEGRAAFSQG